MLRETFRIAMILLCLENSLATIGTAQGAAQFSCAPAKQATTNLYVVLSLRLYLSSSRLIRIWSYPRAIATMHAPIDGWILMEIMSTSITHLLVSAV